MATGERIYARTLDELLGREGDYLHIPVQFEVRIERLSEVSARFISLQVERYLLLRSLPENSYEGIDSKYSDVDARQPVWVYDDELVMPFAKTKVDERTQVFITEPVYLLPESRSHPIAYEVGGYAFRFSMSLPNVRDEEGNLSNNAAQLELLFGH